MARTIKDKQDSAKAKKAAASETAVSKSEMRQTILEGKLAREEEKTRKQAAAASEASSKMDIDPLEDTPAEAEFFQTEARLAAEAQARATGLLPEQGITTQEEEEQVHTHGGNTVAGEAVGGGNKVGFSEGVKTGTQKSVAPASTPDSADSKINQHLRELNMKEDEDVDTTSPVRKKTRAARPDTPGAPKSIIRAHDHKQKRVILEAAVILTDKNPYLQFAEMIRSLLGNALLVDAYFQIDPISKVSPHAALKKKTDIPNNLTLLTEYIKISGNMMAFQKKKVFNTTGSGGKKKKVEEEKDPVVWFCFAASFDLEATYIIQRISFEWGNLGGSRLQVKAVYSFESATPIMCLKLWTETEHSILIAEFKQILLATWEAEKDVLAPLYGDNLVLPEFGIRVTAPWVPGIRADWKTQNSRRVVHFEMDCGVIPLVKHLVARAKALGIVAAAWGLKVLVSESNVPLTERNKELLLTALRAHATFHSKMLDQEIKGIDNLDAKEPFYKVTDPTKVLGYLSLRDLLLKFTKLSCGKPAFAEVHQGCQLGPVTAVFPNVEEAETMVERLNKNAAAYLIFKLQDDGLPEELLRRIAKAACDAETYAKGLTCTWDEKNQTILFPEESEGDEDEMKEQEKTSWYAAEMGMHMVDKVKRSKKKQHTREEDMYDLETVGTVKTIHEANRGRAERAARVAKDLSEAEGEEDDEVNRTRKQKKKETSKPKKQDKATKASSSTRKKQVLEISSESESDSDEDSEVSSMDDDSEDSARRNKGKKKAHEVKHKDSASKLKHGKSRASSGSHETVVLSSGSSSDSSSDSSEDSDSQDDGAGSG